jgi:hypothetical protein
MAKRGPGDAWLVVAGYEPGLYCTEFESSTEALFEESTTLGDSFKEKLPIGVRQAELTLAGFYDDTNDASDEALMTVTSNTERIVLFGVCGQTVGAKATGFEGGYVAKYDRKPTRNGLHKFSGTVTLSGQVDEGIILQELEDKTADWNTEGADSQDNGASSAGGGVAYQAVTSMSGFTGFVGKVRHSSDDSTYADLVTFSNVTAAPSALRGTSAATVNRHLAFDGNVTGTGTIRVCCIFKRNA